MLLTERFELMLQELRSNHLTVVLVPAWPEKHCGHMIRSVESQNPSWYRELCRMFPEYSKRSLFKFKTRLKRQEVIRVLKILARDGATRSQLGKPLERIARELNCEDEEY